MLSANWQGYRVVAQVGIAVLAAAMVFVAFREKWHGVVVLAVFLLLSLYVVFHKSRLPALFETLFVLASLGNAAGYVWNLFGNFPPYDELAHFYTGFAVTLALGFLLYEELMEGFKAHRMMFVVTITSMGVALATAWEVAEWLADFVIKKEVMGGMFDTMTDVILGAVGAFLAALLNLRGLNEA